MAAQEDRAKLIQLVFGSMAAQAVGAAARLGVADHLDGARTAAELAGVCGTDEGATRRLLRALAALELCTEDPVDTFTLTPAGALLRRDRPGSVHAIATMFTDETMLRAWHRLDHAVHTGQRVFDDIFGTDFFGHLDERPDLSATFNASMSEGTRLTASILPSHYPFDRFTTVADIGGGDGTLLAAVLDEHPSLQGILYDTEQGLAQAKPHPRIRPVTGDFFAEAPAGADLHMLKSVLHDWPDEGCVTILSHCRRAMPAGGRLLIVEPVLPETVNPMMPPIMYLSDLNMLVNLDGRERTLGEFEDVCRRAGFAVTEVIALPPPAAFSLIEARPA
jgi:O-methyltransferase domain/Dimerisation domain